MRRISSFGLNLIKKFEGKRNKAYRDPTGTWTIGYGQTKNVKPGMIWSDDKVENDLKGSIKEYEGYVNKYVKAPINQNQFDALTSLAWNAGPGVVKKAAGFINSNDMEGAMRYMSSITKSKGRELPGLVRRRFEELDLFVAPDNKINNIKRQKVAVESITPKPKKQQVSKEPFDAITRVQKYRNLIRMIDDY